MNQTIFIEQPEPPRCLIRPSSQKRVWIFGAELLAALFLYGGLFKSLFLGVCLLFVASIWMLSDHSAIFSFLFFLLPFACIFKNTTEGISGFTYLEFLAAFILIFRYKRIDVSVLILTLFFVFQVLFVSCGGYASVLKLVCRIWIAFVFVKRVETKDATVYSYSFFGGIFLSSLIGMQKLQISSLAALYEDYNGYASGGLVVYRFSGLISDPNYYAVYLILALFMLLTLTFPLSKKSLLPLLISALFIGFGFYTLSKSFYFMLLILLFAFFLRCNGNQKLLFLFCLMLFLLASFGNPPEIIIVFLVRLQEGQLTTGRVQIWILYLYSLWESGIRLLFGHGIDSSLARDSHNLLLALLYKFGILGTIQYFLLLFAIFGKRWGRGSSKWFYSTGFLILFIMYQFISGLDSYELFYFLMLAFCIPFLDTDFEKGRSSCCQNF